MSEQPYVSRQLQDYRRKMEIKRGIPWDQQEHKVGRKPIYEGHRERECRRASAKRFKELKETDPVRYEEVMEKRRKYHREWMAAKRAVKREAAALTKTQEIKAEG